MLELPQSAKTPEPAKDPAPAADLPGTICPFRCGTFAYPKATMAGDVHMQPGRTDVPCSPECMLYLPSNRSDKPGSCAIAEAGRALRTLARKQDAIDS